MRLALAFKMLTNVKYALIEQKRGARGGAVGRGTTLQAGRSRVRIPDGVTGIFH
jgi:hypothetical protein